MIYVEVLGAWFVIGLAFLVLQNLGKGKERIPHVLPPSNGQRRQPTSDRSQHA